MFTTTGTESEFQHRRRFLSHGLVFNLAPAYRAVNEFVSEARVRNGKAFRLLIPAVDYFVKSSDGRAPTTGEDWFCANHAYDAVFAFVSHA
ncbi:hypothetical protein [Enterobacter hormaechei]|uniref:hypothetical protein n=1 Tax=Enterobacter hormaechei TaxID=158836 RepID=UPI002985B174|nr:hypothetical protein [Enterobacter hormaechei]